MPLQTQSPWTTLVLLVAMAAVFYFLMIRPQRRRARQQQEALAALEPGVRVLLGSGFYATLVEMRDTEADVELAPGLVVTVVRQAVVRAVPQESGDTEIVPGPPVGPATEAYPRDLDATGDPQRVDEQRPAGTGSSTTDASTTDASTTDAPHTWTEPGDNSDPDARRQV